MIILNSLFNNHQLLICKGPWKNLKQVFLKLSKEDILEFVNENGDALGICWFKHDEIKVKLVNKQEWDMLDDYIKTFK